MRLKRQRLYQIGVRHQPGLVIGDVVEMLGPIRDSQLIQRIILRLERTYRRISYKDLRRKPRLWIRYMYLFEILLRLRLLRNFRIRLRIFESCAEN